MRYLVPILLLLCSCNSENSWTGTHQEPGGIWVGPEYVLIVAEDGRVIWWDPAAENFGDGSATVHIKDLSLTFEMRGPGGPAPASCTGTGRLIHRHSMTLTIECVGGNGVDIFVIPEATLDYEPTYDRDSSMTMIAGLYDVFENGNEIIDINADGTIFSQDVGTGCISSGRVSVIDENYNLYDSSVTLSDCNAQNDGLNGLTSSGFLILDNQFQPGEEFLLYVGITDHAGLLYGVWFEAKKL